MTSPRLLRPYSTCQLGDLSQGKTTTPSLSRPSPSSDTMHPSRLSRQAPASSSRDPSFSYPRPILSPEPHAGVEHGPPPVHPLSPTVRWRNQSPVQHQATCRNKPQQLTAPTVGKLDPRQGRALGKRRPWACIVHPTCPHDARILGDVGVLRNHLFSAVRIATPRNIYEGIMRLEHSR